MKRDDNYYDFTRRAILSQREACCMAEQMVLKAKYDDLLDFPLCEEGRQMLFHSLSHFRHDLLHTQFPPRRTRYSTYAIDLLADGIDFGIVTYPEDTKFDESGYPCPREDGGDSEQQRTYQRLMHIFIPTIPLKLWAEWNGVSLDTARAWAEQGRIRTFDEGGDETRVSGIQYLPDAPYQNKALPVRFHAPGVLPESLTAEYPFLGGEVFDILFTSERRGFDGRFSYSLRVISRPDAGAEPGVITMTLQEDERDAVLKALLSVERLRADMDSRYRSPVEADIFGAAYRYASLSPEAEDHAVLRKRKVSGACFNDSGDRRVPGFSIEVDCGALCTVSGYATNMNWRGENERVKATGGTGVDLAECRRRVLGEVDALSDVVGAYTDFKFKDLPWNRRILFITGVDIPDGVSDRDVLPVLKTLPDIAEQCFAFSPSLIIAAFPLDVSRERNYVGLFLDSGFSEVQDWQCPYTDYQIFYAYAKE